MAIVAKDRDGAEKMRNFCDKLHGEISIGKKITPLTTEELKQLTKVDILGVLTLEDVIEKILHIDIKDEKDREQAALGIFKRSLTTIKDGDF
jgi:hypothetical protein